MNTRTDHTARELIELANNADCQVRLSLYWPDGNPRSLDYKKQPLAQALALLMEIAAQEGTE